MNFTIVFESQVKPVVSSVIEQIREFTTKHKEVEDQLNNWYTIAEKADWATFNEMRQLFNSVDAVGSDLYVFKFLSWHLLQKKSQVKKTTMQ